MIGRIIGLGVVIGLVAPFVVTGLPAVVGAEQSYVVLSGSMAAEPEPMIKPGDVIIVNSVDASALEENDIITFDRGGDTPTTHRIVDVQQQDGQRHFITKGDNNEDADPQPVSPDQVIGRVMFTIPLIGHVVQFANTTVGFATLVGVPIGLLVVSEAWAFARDPEDAAGGAAGSGDDDDEATSAPDPTATGASADETVTVGEAELKKALILLLPVVAATAIASYRLQTAWALTLLYASAGLFLLGGVLYLRMTGWIGVPGAANDEAGPDDPDDSVAVDERADKAAAAATANQPAAGAKLSDPVVTGRVRDAVDESDRVLVEVPDRRTLLEIARERGRHAIEHPKTEAVRLIGDQTVFRYTPAGTTVEDGEAAPDALDVDVSFDGQPRDTATDGGDIATAADETTHQPVADDDTDEWVAAVEQVVTDESTDDPDTEPPQDQ
jgi:signal peptidase